MNKTNKKSLPSIEIDAPFKYFDKVITEREEYKDDVIGEYINSLLYAKCCSPTLVVEWLKDNRKDIDFIVEEIMKSIYTYPYSLEMFDICCSLNFQKTKDIYVSQREYFKEEFLYDNILEKHKLQRELDEYKMKYQSMKKYMEYMSNGLLYFEMKDDYDRYMNQIQ